MTRRDRGGAAGAWLVGGFLFCPCHLPVTLWLLTVALSGTALETVVRPHGAWVAVIVTSIWLAATIRGLTLLRRGGST